MKVLPACGHLVRVGGLEETLAKVNTRCWVLTLGTLLSYTFYDLIFQCLLTVSHACVLY